MTMKQSVRAVLRIALALMIVPGCTVSEGTKKSSNSSPLITASPDDRSETGLGRWQQLPKSPLRARAGAAAVWTGTELVVWGGTDHKRFFSDGAAYDPDTSRWRTLAKSPLGARTVPSAVWTGRVVLVWGGAKSGHEVFGDGAAYNPRTDSWRLLPPGPDARYSHTATWTGDRMIVWGGTPDKLTAPLSDGASYDPAGDAWTTVAESPLTARLGHSAVWNGARMIVFGGADYSKRSPHDRFRDGALYDPRSDAWSDLPPAETRRAWHSALWADGALWVVGGLGGMSDVRTTMATWSRNGWTSAPSPDGLGANSSSVTPIGTKRFLVWGGSRDSAARDVTAEGAVYDLRSDEWQEVGASPLSARQGHVAVWTGAEIIIWGGHGRCCGSRHFVSDGASFVID